MVTEIKSEKKSISEFLNEGQKSKFLIPDYQREYSWQEEQIQSLFDDLTDYLDKNKTKLENEDTNIDPFFLGCVVYYKNEDNKLEIIDGQQRITTLFLFLRALYDKIINDTSQNALHQKENIEKLLWKTSALNGKLNKDEILLESKVATDKSRETLTKILKDGAFDGIEKDKSNYAMNYLQIKGLLDTKFATQIMSLPIFIYAILTNVIIIPIIANSQDSALQIFTTLNDRGLSLADADIFKSEIYKHLTTNEEKDKFIEEWNGINELAKEIKTDNVNLDRIFYYYMMYNRAKQNDVDTTTPRLRAYYKQFKELLFDPKLIDNLKVIITFLKSIDFDNKQYSKFRFNNIEIEKMLNILYRYPNEWWKYACIVFYMVHYSDSDFEITYLDFLKNLLKVLTLKYLEEPSISKIKPIILKINQNSISSKKFISIEITNKNKLCEEVIKPSKKIAPMLLSMLAYNDKNQNELLPTKCQKEHILPKQWKSIYNPSNYNSSEVNEFIDHIGNYLPLEAKINVKASNEWLKNKKQYYKNSKISIVKKFESQISDTWDVEKIKERDNEILEIFKNEILR